ncbi:MAG TPA: hypothetical protein VM120_00815 [Bryobacteraceae bacterium]|nr:hypothetical protein [Bryobacteraceae bacterium]
MPLVLAFAQSCALAESLSLVLDGSQTCGLLSTPAKAPFNSLSEFRYEFRIHDFRTNSALQRLFQGVEQIIRIEPNSSILRWYSFTDNMTVQVNLSGRKDIIIRLQRSMSRNLFILEMWNGDGSGYAVDRLPLAKNVPSREAGTLQLGADCQDLNTARDFLRAKVAYFRWSSSTLPPGSPPPAPSDSGDLLDFPFDGNLTNRGTQGISLRVSPAPEFVPTPSNPPVAIVKPPNALRVGDPLPLDGTQSIHLDGKIVSYRWSQLSGPTVLTIANPNAALTQATGTVEGIYSFRLEVTGNAGASAFAVMDASVFALDSKDRIQTPDPRVAFILGPMVAVRSKYTPWPWFDKTILDFGDKWGSQFSAAPPGETLHEGSVSLVKGSAEVTGTGTHFLTEYQNIPASDRYLVVHYPLGKGRTGRRMLFIRSVIDDLHLTTANGDIWDRDPVRSARFGVASSAELNAYENSNYYDQALVQYINFYRTGQTKYRDYARKIVDSRWRYAKTDQGRASPKQYAPRHVGMEGFLLRALDGRPEFWPYIEKYVRSHWDIWLGERRDYDLLYYGPREGGYMLLFGAYLAQLHPSEAIRQEFRSKIEDMAVNYFVRLQFPDGSWRHTDEGYWTGLAEQPFHTGLLLEALIATYQITENPAILVSILRSCDHLTAIYRPAPARGQWYNIYDDACPNGCGADTSSDGGSIREVRALNNTIIHAYGFAWMMTGLDQYRRQGDELFAATFGRAQGPGADAFAGLADFDEKQYNQSFRSSGRYLAWRLASTQPPAEAVQSQVAVLALTAPKTARLERLQLLVGASRQFSVLAFNKIGKPLKAPAVIWKSSNPAAVALDQRGVARGLALGQAQVSVSAGRLSSAPWKITVLPSPPRQQN